MKNFGVKFWNQRTYHEILIDSPKWVQTPKSDFSNAYLNQLAILKINKKKLSFVFYI